MADDNKPTCEFCNYDDFKSQIIYENELVVILYPCMPIFQYHFIVVPKSHAPTFDSLSSTGLSGIHEAIKLVHAKFKVHHQRNYEGYNIFSNNGTIRVGQKVPHFHMHMFIRLSDEPTSPYKIMNEPDLKVAMSSKLHAENIKEFQKVLG